MRLKSNEFRDFIQKSRLKLENNLYRIDADFALNRLKESLNLTRNVMNTLETLTNEGKILWTKDKDEFYGLIIDNSVFSGLKLIIKKQNRMYYSVIFQKKMSLNKRKYLLTVDNERYISSLLESIEQKFILEFN